MLSKYSKIIKERSGFLDQAEKAIKLQMEAQETAEKAIQQLEDFINEDAQIVFLLSFFSKSWERNFVN